MTMKNLELRDILLVILIGLVVWQFIDSGKDKTEPQPIQVVIPGSSGSSGVQTIESVKTVPVYIPGQGQIIVDESYKRLYEEAKDSLERANLYLAAIKINKYDTTVINNDTIRLDFYAKTRGSLLEYKVDYNIKPQVFEYTPETLIKRPRLSLGLGVQAGVPTKPLHDFSMQGNLSITNQKGHSLIGGYDTDNRVWFGYRKEFNLIK